jgi:formylglycine-generating enzyme required for sulfatase activity
MYADEIRKSLFLLLKRTTVASLIVSGILFFFGCSENEKSDDSPYNMVLVKGGPFVIGKTDQSAGHYITVSSFYLGKYELTQKEWIAVAGYNSSWFKGDSLPVEQVDWLDVFRFCNNISIEAGFQPCYRIDGQILSGELPMVTDDNIWSVIDTLSQLVTCNFNADGYRLPTEAEWEFAARGGNHSKNYLYCGSSDLPDVAWFVDNSDRKTHPVGLKKPNEIGLYDMSGNVIERCWDWYEEYSNRYQIDPTGPAEGTTRIVRGGSWSSGNNSCMIAYRHHHPSYRDYSTGFRLCRNAD